MPRKLDALLEQMEREAETFTTLNTRALRVTRDWIDYRSALLMQEWAETEHDPIEDLKRRGKQELLEEQARSISELIETKNRELEGQEEES